MSFNLFIGDNKIGRVQIELEASKKVILNS